MLIRPLAFLLLTAIPVSAQIEWRTSADITTDSEECVKGKARLGKECVRKGKFEVTTPDGTGTGIVRYVMVLDPQDPRSALWGLADEKNKIVVEPGRGNIYALNTRGVLRCRPTECEYASADGKSTPLGLVVDMPLPSGRPLHMARVKDADGRAGLAPVLLDGTLGPVLPGATMAEAITANNGGVFTVRDSSGSAASVMVSNTGQIVWSGPEMHEFCVYRSVECKFMQVTGKSPLTLTWDPNLYTPFDSAGELARLPPGVLGMAPAFKQPATATHVDGSKAADNVWVWLIVEKKGKGYQYRLVDGAGTPPLSALAKSASLPAYDDVRAVPIKKGGVASTVWYDLAAHRPKEGDWVANPTVMPGYAATPEAAVAESDRLRELDDRARTEAMDRARSEGIRDASRASAAWAALAQAEKNKRAAALRNQYGAEFDRPCAYSNSEPFHCKAVEDAAFEIGEPDLSRYLSHQSGFYSGASNSDKACAISLAACDAAQAFEADSNAKAAARRAAQARHEAAWKDAVQKFTQGPEYTRTVSYYEGGRLLHKTMTEAEYNQVYGNPVR